jgi:hypothetical protein
MEEAQETMLLFCAAKIKTFVVERDCADRWRLSGLGQRLSGIAVAFSIRGRQILPYRLRI